MRVLLHLATNSKSGKIAAAAAVTMIVSGTYEQVEKKIIIPSDAACYIAHCPQYVSTKYKCGKYLV